MDISNNKCNPWRIASPNRKTDKAENVPWFPQITTSMPLEALYSLMKENIADPDKGRNKLNGDSARYSGGKLIALVTEEHFQSQPNGIDGSKVGDDVLGFLTLVLSYAKAAKEGLRPDQSPKLFIPFMPRTEFNTIYQQVSSQLCGDLFELFRVLACYKRVGKGLDSGLM